MDPHSRKRQIEYIDGDPIPILETKIENPTPTIKRNIKTKKTFEAIMAEFKPLSPEKIKAVKKIATNQLLERGVEEIGSSDLNHAIVGLYNHYDSFDSIVENN
jgi:hypothetical protein